ncbi:MAG: O-antigen ligase family protein, partial [Rhizobiaceae bacterium]
MTAASKKALPVFLLLIASLVSTNIYFQLTYLSAIIIVVILASNKINIFYDIKTLIISLIIIYTIYTLIYLYNIGFEGPYIRDLSKIHILIILVVAFAAGSAIGTNLLINIPKFSRILLAAMILIAVLHYVLNTQIFGVVRTRFLLTQYQYNRNHLDDLYLFQVFVSFQLLMFIVYFERLRRIDIFAGGFLISIYFAMFLSSGSLGGFVGCLIALFVFSVSIVVATKNARIAVGLFSIPCLIAVVVFSGVLGSSIDERISRTWMQWNALSFHEILTYDSDILGKCKARAQNEKPVLPSDITKKPTTVYGVAVLRKGELVDRSMPILLQANTDELPAISRVDPTISARLVLWRDALRIWLQSPFWGHGEYNPDKLIESYDNINSCNLRYFAHVHNFYLDLLIQGGMLFFLFYVYFVFLAYRLILRNFEIDKKWVLMGPALFFITYLVVENYFDMTLIWRAAMESNLMNFALLTGLAAGIYSKDQDNKNIDRLEQSIRSTISKKGSPDFEARSEIYRSAMRAFEKLPLSEQNRLRPQLIEVLKKIEADYSNKSGEPTVQEQIAGEVLPDERGNTATDVAEVFSDHAKTHNSKKSSKFRLAGYVVLLIAVAGLGISFFLGWFDTAVKKLVGNFDLSKPEIVGEYSSNTLYSIKLPKHLDQLSENVIGQTKSEKPFSKFVSGYKFLVNNDVLFFAKELLSVDTSKTYMMQLTMSVEQLKGKWPR